MTVQQLQRMFKVTGKVLWLYQQSAEWALSIRTVMSGLVDQTVSGLASESEAITKFLTPATASMDTVVRSLDGVAGSSVKNLELYFRNQIAALLGLPTNASMNQIGAALVSEMTSNTQTVGVGSDFAEFFAETWSITLPTSLTPSISDAWISDSVVAE